MVIDLSVKNKEIAQVNNLFKEADMIFNKLLRNPSGKSDLLTENSLKSKINQFDSNSRLSRRTPLSGAWQFCASLSEHPLKWAAQVACGKRHSQQGTHGAQQWRQLEFEF